MKYILILITSILLVSCNSWPKTLEEPIIRDKKLARSQDNSKYFYSISVGNTETGFWSNKEYNINDTLSICNHVVIDLPEEYPLISENSNNPDTLIGYYKNGKLYIRFLAAARNYPKDNH